MIDLVRDPDEGVRVDLGAIAGACLNSVRFISLASFDTGVLAFECIFSSLISDAEYSLRTIFFLIAFFATPTSVVFEPLDNTIILVIKRSPGCFATNGSTRSVRKLAIDSQRLLW
jgi:hypothetical protein